MLQPHVNFHFGQVDGDFVDAAGNKLAERTLYQLTITGSQGQFLNRWIDSRREWVQFVDAIHTVLAGGRAEAFSGFVGGSEVPIVSDPPDMLYGIRPAGESRTPGLKNPPVTLPEREIWRVIEAVLVAGKNFRDVRDLLLCVPLAAPLDKAAVTIAQHVIAALSIVHSAPVFIEPDKNLPQLAEAARKYGNAAVARACRVSLT